MKHVASRRFALRASTSAAHEALDARVAPLFGTRDGYARYLAGLHAFRATAEALLAGAWQPAPIAALIAADMADLGATPQPPVTFALADDPSARLGLGYVLAGSALGARLLQRDALALGFDADHGARHLAAQTADPAAWGAFCGMLEAADPFDPDAATDAAIAAFDAAGRAFRDDVP